MSQQRHEKISELFSKARRLHGDEREQFLRDACGDDAELRREVDELLTSDAQDSLQTGLLHEEIGRSAEAVLSSMPDQIGPYKIEKLLGEGGMGSVFLAEQTESVQRKVALKLIKLGMDTAAVVRRFEAERQALARMDHPNVAKVLDAGATNEGRPYFVMEYVDGVPLNEHCEQHHLEEAERLELFIQLCDGVQHAHQKGIIHRDLTPSNVLVSTDGERAIPRIIDFGIAKATEQTAEQTAMTQMGQVIGTPAYMSPEQSMRDAAGIDTRSDVYALGVVLYELLTGELPPQSRRERKLAGELDWIVTKALEDERERRYSSARELAQDVQRYLGNQPLLAGPPGVGYIARKFVRRHRSLVAVSSAFIVLLVAAVIFSAYQAVVATREKERAERSARLAEEVSTFLGDLFAATSPWETVGPTTTVADLLDKGETMARERAQDDPFLRARLLASIGVAREQLEQGEAAAAIFDEALQIAEGASADDYETHQHLINVSRRLTASGELDRAKALLDRAESILDRSSQTRPNDRGTLLQAQSALAEKRDQADRAIELSLAAAESYAESGQEFGELHSTSNAAFLAVNAGHNDQAAALAERILGRIRRDGKLISPEFSAVLYHLSHVYWRLGETEQAFDIETEILALAEQYLPPDHPMLGQFLDSYATTLWYLDRLADSIPYYERSLAIVEKHQDPNSVAVSNYNHALIYMHRDFDDPEKAAYHLRRGLEPVATHFPGTSREMRMQVELAVVCSRIPDRVCAKEMIRAGYQSLKALEGTSDRFLPDALMRLAAAAIRANDRNAPSGLFEDAIDLWDSDHYAEQPDGALDAIARLAVTSPRREDDAEIAVALESLSEVGSRPEIQQALLTRLFADAACFYQTVGLNDQSRAYAERSMAIRGLTKSERLHAVSLCRSQ